MTDEQMTDEQLIEMLAQHLRGVATAKTRQGKGINHNTETAKHLKALQYSAGNMLSVIREHQSLKEFHAGLAKSLADGNITIDGDIVSLTKKGLDSFKNSEGLQ